MGFYEIEIEQVNGPCAFNYKVGDKFLFNGFKTIGDFCGAIYIAAYPTISTYEFGGKFSFIKNRSCRTELSCPAKKNIVFRITKT